MKFKLPYPVERIFYFLLFLLGVVYVSNTWSPSSYGFFLKQADPQHSGIIWGQPRPIRSDEWAVVTPLTQATVNNNFHRYNNTSFYKEDLRINYGLPIFDWGLFFKPTMWGYLLFPPAVAFSLHWYLIFIVFVVGYFKFFKEVGVNKSLSLILSFSLFFSGACQFWWDEKGPVYAFFPWVIYFLIAKGNVFYRLVMFYWLGTSWILTNFYPPLFISLAFVAVLIFITHISQWRNVKKISWLVLASVSIVATSLLYLKDYLIKTSLTVYPGHRSFGGGSVSWPEWISQYLPFSTFNSHYDVLYGNNISEIGSVGFAFIIMFIMHIDFKSLNVKGMDAQVKKKLAIWLIGLCAMNIWLLLPVPDWTGRVFLWNNVHPNRMKFSAGLLLGLVVIYFFQNVKLIINSKRFALYTVTILVGWYLMKLKPLIPVSDGLGGVHHNYIDLYAIIALLLAYLLVKFLSFKPVVAFSSTSLAVSCVVLAGFNPIQSAKAIFDKHTVIKTKLDDYVDGKTGVLAVQGYPGAILNGLGYKSVTHVTAVPAIELWKSYFPELPQNEFNKTFNRYSHIHLEAVNTPYAAAPDVVVVPISLFSNISYVPLEQKNSESIVLQLNNNMIAEGKLTVNTPGKLIAFSPLIGTYNGMSNGNLTLTLCVKNHCQEKEVSLKGKADNQYLKIKLDFPNDLEKGEEINYRFSLNNATHPLAFWAVKSEDKVTVASKENQEVKTLSIKFELVYENK
ncbi:hypothetical protein [Pantoea sp.]|uniref:DUF7657 domain-containing protein n=1 Tax=Pantoea sp. TaxID=69393 RepID=UPI00289B1F05|nr:hypothetical protein [Pantoea sp.]